MQDLKMTGSQDNRRIVSSRHLAEGEGWEVSEYEFGLIIAYNAFSRWMRLLHDGCGSSQTLILSTS